MSWPPLLLYIANLWSSKIVRQKIQIFCDFLRKCYTCAEMLTFWRNTLHLQKLANCGRDFAFFRETGEIKNIFFPTLPPAFLLLRFLPPSLCPLVPGAPPSPPLSSLERISPSSRRLRPPPPPFPFLLAGVSSITCKNKYFLTILGSFFKYFSSLFFADLLPWLFRTRFEFEPKSCSSR